MKSAINQYPIIVANGFNRQRSGRIGAESTKSSTEYRRYQRATSRASVTTEETPPATTTATDKNIDRSTIHRQSRKGWTKGKHVVHLNQILQ